MHRLVGECNGEQCLSIKFTEFFCNNVFDELFDRYKAETEVKGKYPWIKYQKF